MAYPNDNFRPPLLNPPYASTPNSVRTQRPRFAYSGPQNYPRPGSSASKPNPDFSVSDIMRSRYVPSSLMNDSMINNCGDSFMDTSLPPYDNSFQSEYSSGSFPSQDSIYYSCNESFSNSPRKPFSSPQHERPQHQYRTNFFEPDVDILPPISNQPVRFKSLSSVVEPNKRKPFYKKKDVKPIGVVSKKHNDGVSKHVWRCSLCDIVFTSSIPYNMHKQGTKHAKKLKLLEATQTVQTQVKSTKEVEMIGTTFRCELCGIIANSPYQLKMHLDGIKHKAKVLSLEQQKQEAEAMKAKTKTENKEETKVNGNEANIESSEKTEADVAKPVGWNTKTDFSCDICKLFLNSNVQLQQHLLGKFHKAMVEGTPLPTHAKKRAAIRKGVDPNATEVKESGQVDVCKSNPTERISETNKNLPPKTAMDVQPETIKDVQSETSKTLQLGTSEDIQPETTKDNQSKTSKDSQPETSKDSQPEITRT